MRQNCQQIRQGLKGGKKEKGNSNPLTKKFYPPGQVLSKVHVKTYWMRKLLQKQKNKSIIWRRKVQLGQTNMQVWYNRLINDWRSFLVQHLRVDQWDRASCKAENVSARRHAIWATVSNSIPRTTTQEAVPLVNVQQDSQPWLLCWRRNHVPQ